MNKLIRWATHIHDNWFKDEANLWIAGEIDGKRYVIKHTLEINKEYDQSEISKIAQDELDDLEKQIESESS